MRLWNIMPRPDQSAKNSVNASLFVLVLPKVNRDTEF
jgi:hypothetical protein